MHRQEWQMALVHRHTLLGQTEAEMDYLQPFNIQLQYSIGTGVYVSFAPDRTRYGEGGGLKEATSRLHRKPYCLFSHVPHAKGSKGQTAIS